MVKTVKLEEIVSDDNRKYTKEDGFEQLVSSIERHGIIEQPVVRMLEDGRFKVVAGRRRIAALRRLNVAETDCAVYGDGDCASDEEIAAAENINRLEMHPLDEAALFSSMADGGKSVEEIARHYARSPSAIYKRLRLSALTEELKGMFRDGILNIAGAALLAELPDENQKKFHELYGHKDKEVEHAVVSNFFYKSQKNKIEKSMKGCELCVKRTHNEGNSLFKEYDYLTDVCLDGDCYRATWYEMINAALTAVMIQMNEAGIKTDDKIFFDGQIAKQMYGKANFVKFNIENKLIDFEVLREKDYERGAETNRKKDACWEIRTDYEGNVKIKRVGYKARPVREKAPEAEAADNVKVSGKGINKKEIDVYGREALEAAAEEMQTTSAELVKKLRDTKIYSYNYKEAISDLVIGRVIDMNIKRDCENSKKNPGRYQPRDYLGLFMEILDDESFVRKTYIEEEFDDEQKRWLRGLFGVGSIKSISKEFDEDAQKMFHFLLITMGFRSDVPEPEDFEKEKEKDEIFLRYADIGADEYRALYLQAAKEATARMLKPKEKKEKKKKETMAQRNSRIEKNSPNEPDDELDDETEYVTEWNDDETEEPF